MRQVRFKLRERAGEPVPIAPWKQTWGGGSSVENPHVQRVHYCKLLVQAGPTAMPACDVSVLDMVTCLVGE